MRQEGICNDIYNEDCSKKGQVQFVSEHDEFICQECGDRLSIVSQSSMRIMINKLKSPLVSGVIGGISLLGGGAYYCLSGDGFCSFDTNSTKVIVKEKNETKVVPFIAKPKPKLENEKDERTKKINHEWNIVKDSTDIELLKEFNRRYPNSSYFPTIEIKIAEQLRIQNQLQDAWNRVKNSGNISKLRHFRKSYPSSKYDNEAVSKIEALKRISRLQVAWNRVKNSGSISKLRHFRKSYPSSKYDNEAVSKIEALKRISRLKRLKVAWNRVKNSGNISKLRHFRTSYPSSKYDDEAVSKIEALKRNSRLQNAWNRVKNSGSISTLRHFRESYPNSVYDNEAVSKIEALKRKSLKDANRTFSLTIQKPKGSRIVLFNLAKNIIYYDGIKIKEGKKVHIKIKKDGFKVKDLWRTMNSDIIVKGIVLVPKKTTIKQDYKVEDYNPQDIDVNGVTTSIPQKTTITIPLSSVKSCREELEELKDLTGIDKSRKRLQISRSNKCSGSESKELLSL